MTDESQIHPFIEYLYALVSNQHRGALADLRRGLSDPPATAPVMFPYIASWVPEGARYSWVEKVYYLVAALFAYYQSGSGDTRKGLTNQGNMGDHCLAATQNKPQSGSFEMRFAALLRANPDDLPVILRQMVSLLKSADVPINWDRLFYDLCRWTSESKYIQRQWANQFWGARKIDEVQNQETNQ